MRFGPVPTSQAEGTILAHSVQVGRHRLRKGILLAPEDITRLSAADITEITVARLEDGDTHEDIAATRLASALAGVAPSGLRLSKAATGRVNLIATAPGLARVEVAAIHELNACDPMITCATVPPLARLNTGTMLATIKIISYAVGEATLQRAESFAKDALGLHPVRLKTARLILTETEASPQNDKGILSTEKRLAALGMTLHDVIRVPHDVAPLAQAIAEDKSDLTLILTASATSDLHDIAPQALRTAGGIVSRFGMPVDPGNLLFFGAKGNRPVIGLPGCARAPALNGADWVLERIACGLQVRDEDIAQMGVGGLLKEIPSRPRPRDKE